MQDLRVLLAKILLRSKRRKWFSLHRSGQALSEGAKSLALPLGPSRRRLALSIGTFWARATSGAGGILAYRAGHVNRPDSGATLPDITLTMLGLHLAIAVGCTACWPRSLGNCARKDITR